MKKISIAFILCILSSALLAKDMVTEIVILSQEERERFTRLVQENPEVAALYDSIKIKADQFLNDAPAPLEKLYYEGLLDTDPRRVKTVKCLQDVNKVVYFIYASYADDSQCYGNKAASVVSAWAET